MIILDIHINSWESFKETYLTLYKRCPTYQESDYNDLFNASCEVLEALEKFKEIHDEIVSKGLKMSLED